MKSWIPVLLGFIGGIIVGVVIMVLGGMEMLEPYHRSIREIFYPNTDPMAGLLIDPIVFVLTIGFIGALIGSVIVVVHKVLGQKCEKHLG